MNNTTNHQETNKPWPFYIIVGMVMGVLLLGYLLAPKTEEGKLAWIEILGTTNNGTLLNPPVEVSPGQILGLDGQPWAALDDNTWKMVLLVQGDCAETCINRMKELHAMRIRLQRDAEELTLGLLVADAEHLPSVPVADDIHELQLGSSALLENLNQTNIVDWQQPTVVLMNPIDVIMLAYMPDNSGVEILEDFEHLLKLAH
tara:strand:- start:102 stop:707 length:606 start_codon:yes stop_codon:yes gene_type:complete